MIAVRWPSNNPTFANIEIPDRIRDITLCSDGRSGRWQEEDGSEWTLSLLEFGGGIRGISQWAPMHTPDICYPAAGMPLQKSYPPLRIKIPGGAVQLQSWEFRRRGGSVIVFYALHDGTSSTGLGNPYFQDLFGISRALEGQRNLGQQTLELAVIGYSSYEQALQALEERLGGIVALKK